MFGLRRGRGESAPDEQHRKTWHGANQARPRLPYYFRTKPRLKSLDEFEEPEWKGRVRFPGDDPVTFGGVVRETFWWLAVFAIVAVVGVALWMWLSGGDHCAELFGGFRMGWC